MWQHVSRITTSLSLTQAFKVTGFDLITDSNIPFYYYPYKQLHLHYFQPQPLHNHFFLLLSFRNLEKKSLTSETFSQGFALF